ncbi:MAG: DUF4105 domain-containing protein [Prevotella sp.]|nr:DUF4105 domain-containing protein [Prevotella sp.]
MAFNTEYYDSVEISLLTCQPHDEVYSLYGHTAIRYHDKHSNGYDITLNYGVFDWKKPYFVARFILGLTDYELGAFPYPLFLMEYRHFGSMVTEQVLNLSSYEKSMLHRALSENLLPANRVYRYNYFYNNCTTKARDIIEQCVNGRVEYAEDKYVACTYRDIVHDMTRNNPWTQFGNDLLLGIKADQTIGRREHEFLPANLMYDFDRANINAGDSIRPLVSERRIAVPSGVQMVGQSFPVTPWQMAIFLAVMAIGIYSFEIKRRKAFRLWDITLMITVGTIGIVLFLMLFSQHPTVSANLQFILLNPLPWLFLWPVIKGRQTRYWNITAILAVLFLAGALLQHYAEGIHVLALCLLLQWHIHHMTSTKRVLQAKKQK